MTLKIRQGKYDILVLNTNSNTKVRSVVSGKGFWKNISLLSQASISENSATTSEQMLKDNTKCSTYLVLRKVEVKVTTSPLMGGNLFSLPLLRGSLVTFEESLALSFVISPLWLGTREKGAQWGSSENSHWLIKSVWLDYTSSSMAIIP